MSSSASTRCVDRSRGMSQWAVDSGHWAVKACIGEVFNCPRPASPVTSPRLLATFHPRGLATMRSRSMTSIYRPDRGMSSLHGRAAPAGVWVPAMKKRARDDAGRHTRTHVGGPRLDQEEQSRRDTGRDLTLTEDGSHPRQKPPFHRRGTAGRRCEARPNGHVISTGDQQ